MLGAGDAFMSGFLRGWLQGEPLRHLRHLGQCLRRLRGVAPALLAGISDLGGTAVLPRSTAARTGRCARTRRSTTSIGRRRGGRSRRRCWPSPSTTARSSKTWPTGSARRASASTPSSASPCRPSRKVADGRPGFGTLLDDTYGREAMFDAAKLGLWIGRPLEKPGSRPLRFEFTPGCRLAPRRMAGRPTRIKCLVLLSPRRPRRTEGASRRRSSARSTTPPARSAANC